MKLLDFFGATRPDILDATVEPSQPVRHNHRHAHRHQHHHGPVTVTIGGLDAIIATIAIAAVGLAVCWVTVELTAGQQARMLCSMYPSSCRGAR